MNNYFEILVVRDGKHFFATDPRSCRTRDEAQEVFDRLKIAFGKDPDFDISVTYWKDPGGEFLTDEFEEDFTFNVLRDKSVK